MGNFDESQKRTRLRSLSSLLPAVATTGAAAPVLDTKVPPAEVMSEIGRIVRKEFYDRQGLGAFNEAEEGLRQATASGEGLSRRARSGSPR